MPKTEIKTEKTGSGRCDTEGRNKRRRFGKTEID
jgi:hypothetical protein